MDRIRLDRFLAGAAVQVMEAFFMSDRKYVVSLRNNTKVVGLSLFTLDGDDGFSEINLNFGLLEKSVLQEGLEDTIFSSNDVMAIEDFDTGKTVFDRRTFE
jgi:hypothetical protein